jgi:formylglycine-generating enzyme required for sulfatase activity
MPEGMRATAPRVAAFFHTTMSSDRRPAPFPPPWASAWGDDPYGLWAEMEIEGVAQRLRWIEPGTFRMGSPEDEPERFPDEGPRHRVLISRGYWLADTACTQGLWRAVMGANPSHFKQGPEAPSRPVDTVSWDDVQGFLARMDARLPGARAELPSEAEWEYACRAGTETPFSFGADITPEQVNYNGNYPYAGGKKGLYRETTVPVKSLPANPWGLYEMHGNVWEWCADDLRDYRARSETDPRGGEGEGVPRRVLRGGSWNFSAGWARAAFRIRNVRVTRSINLGFRFALRSIEPGRAEPAGPAPEGSAGV